MLGPRPDDGKEPGGEQRQEARPEPTGPNKAMWEDDFTNATTGSPEAFQTRVGKDQMKSFKGSLWWLRGKIASLPLTPGIKHRAGHQCGAQ